MPAKISLHSAVLGLLVGLLSTACSPSTPIEPHVAEARAVSFESFAWSSGAGPCPPGGTCARETVIDAKGALSEDGGKTVRAQLSPSDLAELNALLSAPKMVAWLRTDPSCEAPMSDFSESFELRTRDGKKVAVVMRGGRGEGCDEALFASLEQQVTKLSKSYRR